MANTPPAHILDSFAILAYFQAAAGGAAVRALLEAARDGEARLYLSVINLGEIYYLMSREQGREHADELLNDLRALPITLIPATEERVLTAARIKAEYPLSYADAFVVGLARELNAIIVTGDPEFGAISSTMQVMWLPTR